MPVTNWSLCALRCVWICGDETWIRGQSWLKMNCQWLGPNRAYWTGGRAGKRQHWKGLHKAVLNLRARSNILMHWASKILSVSIFINVNSNKVYVEYGAFFTNWGHCDLCFHEPGAYREGVGVGGLNFPHPEVLTKLNRIPSSVENTSVTT
jgi:hypothetical protein